MLNQLFLWPCSSSQILAYKRVPSIICRCKWNRCFMMAHSSRTITIVWGKSRVAAGQHLSGTRTSRFILSPAPEICLAQTIKNHPKPSKTIKNHQKSSRIIKNHQESSKIVKIIKAHDWPPLRAPAPLLEACQLPGHAVHHLKQLGLTSSIGGSSQGVSFSSQFFG